MNEILLGDNLTIMNNMESNIDLAYLDPPFNKGRTFKGRSGKFKDAWNISDIDDSYVDEIKKHEKLNILLESILKIRKDAYPYSVFMSIRLLKIHALMKHTGTLYFHCDYTSSHMIKIILDVIFGVENFRNEIVWCYTGPGNYKAGFKQKHDIIYRYTKSAKFYFSTKEVLIPYSEKFLSRRKYAEGGGIFNTDKPKGSEMYLGGKSPEDWWDDIPSGGQISSKELLGYPTQKPEKLLKRIILSSSKPGDLVFDPFCGSGTSLYVAKILKRNYIGIDILPEACMISKKRINGLLL